MPQRDLGGMGEAILELWAKSAGLKPNPAKYDKCGWDFTVKLPRSTDHDPAANRNIESLDQLPLSATCFVQVKARDGRKPPTVKLTNWEGFLNPIPAFYLVLDFDGGSTPVRAALIHVGEELIGAVLKRLRELTAAQSKALHRYTMQLAWSEQDQLPSLDGAALRAALERHIGDPARYWEKKRRWIDRVGYGENRYHLTLRTTATPETTADRLLVDFAIGLRKDLPSTLVALDEIRFGIPRAIERDLPKQVTVRRPSLPPTNKARLEFTMPGSHQVVRFDTRLYDPRAMFPFLPRESLRFRFAADFGDFIIGPTPDAATFSYHLDDARHTFADLVSCGEMVKLAASSRASNTPAQMTIKLGEGGTVYTYGLRFNEPVDESRLAWADAACDAGAIARLLNLDMQVPAGSIDVEADAHRLKAVRALLDPELHAELRIAGEMKPDSELPPLVGHPVVAGCAIGPWLIVIGAALHGLPTPGPRSPDGSQSFKLQPQVTIVEKMIVTNEQAPSIPTRPIYRKIRAWLDERRIPTPPPKLVAGEP